MSDIWQPHWSKGDLIRNKKTGKPMMVVHVYHRFCTMVVDLEADTDPAIQYVLLERTYADWGRDQDFQENKESDKLEYRPVKI